MFRNQMVTLGADSKIRSQEACPAPVVRICIKTLMTLCPRSVVTAPVTDIPANQATCWKRGRKEGGKEGTEN